MKLGAFPAWLYFLQVLLNAYHILAFWHGEKTQEKRGSLLSSPSLMPRKEHMGYDEDHSLCHCVNLFCFTREHNYSFALTILPYQPYTLLIYTLFLKYLRFYNKTPNRTVMAFIYGWEDQKNITWTATEPSAGQDFRYQPILLYYFFCPVTVDHTIWYTLLNACPYKKAKIEWLGSNCLKGVLLGI